MPRLIAAVLLLCLLAPAQEVVPTGITCCDEQKIRLAMAEEALQRIAAKRAGGPGTAADYMSDQAYEKIRRRLPAGTREQLIDFLRAALLEPAPDKETREFQEQVGHFVLGMTLEIGHTFQDEYDAALAARERIDRLLAELEESPPQGEADLGRLLFRADMSEKELRRIRALPARWREAEPDASSFDEFNALKRNMTGRPADNDQKLSFALAGKYSGDFPFLDEFLAGYRRLAAGFLEAARRVNSLLAAPPG
jgi:hypothetical protein